MLQAQGKASVQIILTVEPLRWWTCHLPQTFDHVRYTHTRARVVYRLRHNLQVGTFSKRYEPI